MNRLKRITLASAAVVLGAAPALVASAPAHASDCYTGPNNTLVCANQYDGGANNVQFVNVVNTYRFPVFMATKSSPQGPACIAPGESFTVEAWDSRGVAFTDYGKRGVALAPMVCLMP